MEAPAYWSLDRKDEKGMEKALLSQARTIDFAKFGRLYLNKGNWEGNQIVSRAWVRATIQILVIIADIITTIIGELDPKIQ
jgi:hypothetical protein